MLNSQLPDEPAHSLMSLLDNRTTSRGGSMTATAAERAVLVRRWERASEWPLMAAAVVFLSAYAIPILHPNLPSWLLDLCSSLSRITWVIFAVTSSSG